MTTKPDRFQRMIMKRINVGESYDPFFHYDDVIDLLRNEHRAVVRIIKDYARQCVPPGNERCVEVWEAVPIIEKTCQELLSKLNERAL